MNEGLDVIIPLAIVGAIVGIVTSVWRKVVGDVEDEDEPTTPEIISAPTEGLDGGETSHAVASREASRYPDEKNAVLVVSDVAVIAKLKVIVAGVLFVLVGSVIIAWNDGRSPSISWALILSAIWAGVVWLFPPSHEVGAKLRGILCAVLPLFYGACFFGGGLVAYSAWAASTEAILKRSPSLAVPRNDLYFVVTRFDEWKASLSVIDHAKLVSHLKQFDHQDPKASVILFLVVHSLIDPEDRPEDAYGERFQQVKDELCVGLDLGTDSSNRTVVEKLSAVMIEDSQKFFERRFGLTQFNVNP